jgi:hypothetical protein
MYCARISFHCIYNVCPGQALGCVGCHVSPPSSATYKSEQVCLLDNANTPSATHIGCVPQTHPGFASSVDALAPTGNGSFGRAIPTVNRFVPASYTAIHHRTFASEYTIVEDSDTELSLKRYTSAPFNNAIRCLLECMTCVAITGESMSGKASTSVNLTDARGLRGVFHGRINGTSTRGGFTSFRRRPEVLGTMHVS